MRIRMILMTALAVAALAGCHKNKGGTTTGGGGGGKLFDRLGGMDGITGVVKDFVENNVAKDERINKFFANADIAKLEKNLVDQICEASGGPCKYAGKDMKTAHAGMGIAEGDFGALVEDLVKALDKAGVKPDDKQTLLGVLGPMKPDIVTK
jgi:hemoglobin